MKKLLLLIATSIIMTSTVLAEDSMLDKFEKIMEEKYEQEQEKADEQYENENFSGKRNILYEELMQNVREQQRKTSHISGEVDYDIAVTMSGKSLNNPENDVNEMVLDFSGNAKFAAQEDGTWMAKSSNGNITSELVLGIPSEVYANIKNGKMTIFYYFDADETWHQSVFNVNVDFIYDFSDSYPDFIKYAKKNKILVGPGRGSAAGSLVAYTLGITEIDPLKYDLLFERFLNKDRKTMPDIDTDFPDNRRDEVIEYVKNKYGENNVAGIITFGTLGGRASVRDVGRILAINTKYIDIICKKMPFKGSKTSNKRCIKSNEYSII